MTAFDAWWACATDDEPDEPDDAETPNWAITMVVMSKASEIAKARGADMRKCKYSLTAHNDWFPF